MRDGRVFSTLARPSPSPVVSTKPEDPTSVGARLTKRLEQLRKTLANDGTDVAFEQAKQDTIKQIESENRARERRERQLAKKARRKERQRLAAAQPPT